MLRKAMEGQVAIYSQSYMPDEQYYGLLGLKWTFDATFQPLSSWSRKQSPWGREMTHPKAWRFFLTASSETSHLTSLSQHLYSTLLPRMLGSGYCSPGHIGSCPLRGDTWPWPAAPSPPLSQPSRTECQTDSMCSVRLKGASYIHHAHVMIQHDIQTASQQLNNLVREMRMR